MKRRIPGLSQLLPVGQIPEGLYLVRVDHVRYCRSKQKSFYKIQFIVLEPGQFRGTPLPARFDCSAKAIWKLTWFLRDFGYDTELLQQDELDEKRILGLQGAIKVSHTTGSGRTHLNLDGFATAHYWDQGRAVLPGSPTGAEPGVA